MRAPCFEEISRIARKIHLILKQEHAPGERIPAERVWAERLQVSHNRVHRALQMLTQEGMLFSSGGRRGIFLVSVGPREPHPSRNVTLKLYLPPDLPRNTQMYHVWCRICNMFHVSHPEVKIEITSDRAASDVLLTWPPLLDVTDLQELPTTELASEGELLPRIFCAGELNGRCYGLPLLHSPACFWGHRNILSKNGFQPSDFHDPLDFFRWGNQLNNARECASGFSFFGFTYHATQWGVEFRRQGDFFLIDPHLLRLFLQELYDLVPLANLHYSPYPNSHFFHRGQQALVANYLHSFPITENRFAMLGQPLRKNGFANHTAFMLSAAKHTHYPENVYDLMRFCLTESVQKLFFLPIIHFSVRKKLYEQQYRELAERTTVSIPPYDPRGYFPGLQEDLWIAASSFYYLQCAACLAHYTRIDLAVEQMQRVNIRELRLDWLRRTSEAQQQEYSDYARRIAAEQPD